MCMKQASPMSRPQRPLAAGLFYMGLGILSAMAFTLSPQGFRGMSDLPASTTSGLWSALALVLGALSYYTYVQRAWRPRWFHVLFGLLFALLNFFSLTLFAYDSWASLAGALPWMKAVAQIIGQSLPMTAALTLMDGLLTEGLLTQPARAPRASRFPRLLSFYCRHTVLAVALFLGLCWLPYLVVFYPGTVSWDIAEMLAQFFGLREMDTWHPVFLTWLTGGFFWLGRQLGGDHIGAVLFMLFQTAVLAAALGYAVHFMRRMGASRLMQGLSLCFFGLTPIFASYAQFICKDTLYTALLLLFTLETLTVLTAKEPLTAKRLLRYGLWGLFACLLRSNGIYVVLPTAFFVIAFGAKGKARLPLAGALCGALGLALLFSGVLLPALGIKDETASGLYSLCFQQSARTLRDHPDTVTPEEYAELDRVLDGENLAQLYEPWISDPVKFTFKYYGQGAAAEKAALSQYQKTWAAMLPKYPVTYLEAFVAGNSAYYAFTPKMEGETYNDQAGNRFVFETHYQQETHLDVHAPHPAATDKPRTLLAAFARGWRHIPLVSALYSCALYTWLLVGAGLSLARRGLWKKLIGFLPALLSLATCLLSPVNDYFRYFLPIVAMTLPLIAFASAPGPLAKTGHISAKPDRP